MLVGTGTDHGPWVSALVAAGYRVFPVNPLQSARFRARHSVSGAKSDAGDAHVLADMVRTDSHQLPEAAGGSPEAAGIKVLARTVPDTLELLSKAPGPRQGRKLTRPRCPPR